MHGQNPVRWAKFGSYQGIERFFAHLGAYYKQKAENFSEFVQRGCIRLLPNHFRPMVEDVE